MRIAIKTLSHNMNTGSLPSDSQGHRKRHSGYHFFVLISARQLIEIGDGVDLCQTALFTFTIGGKTEILY